MGNSKFSLLLLFFNIAANEPLSISRQI